MIQALTYVEAFSIRRLIGAIVSAVLGYHLLLVIRPTNNINLRESHDRWYGEPQAGDAVRLYLLAVVGSSSTSTPAFETGTWPDGVDIQAYNSGIISGKGGLGGKFDSTVDDANAHGRPGGLGLKATAPIKIYNGGTIQGGSGGGGCGQTGYIYENQLYVVAGGGGGGGGAGREGGLGGVSSGATANPGQPGTVTAGGAGGVGATNGSAYSAPGGAGGNPGQAGSAGSSSPAGPSTFGFVGNGGAAGAAIEGISNISWIDVNGDPTANQGTILGATS